MSLTRSMMMITVLVMPETVPVTSSTKAAHP
jgi:hypothetical protein